MTTGSLNVLAGAPGCGKTFAALDLALNVTANHEASPRLWLGKTVRIAGPVVYVLGEGIGRFGLRVQAWRQAHGSLGHYPFLTLPEPIDLLEPSNVGWLLDQLEGLSPSPALVVIDPLARFISADENQSTTMSGVVDACDRIRAKTGATVLVLHHMSVEGRRERGHSALRGAADAVYTMRTDRKNRHRLLFDVEKSRDLDYLDHAIALRLKPVPIEGRIEPSGRPMFSCVVDLDQHEPAQQPNRPSLLQVIANNPGLSQRAIAKKAGGNHAVRLDELKALAANGSIQLVGSGRTKQVYPAAPVQEAA
jgi:hypothetical protein